MSQSRPARPVRGAIFDLDGTLVDSRLDFARIRRDMRFTGGGSLLEWIDRLPAVEARRCRAILDRHELDGALRSTPLPGVIEFLDAIDARGLNRAIATRNSRHATRVALRCAALAFDHCYTRDDGPFKPDPWAIYRACECWGVTPSEVVVFGDYVYDIEAGRAAGAWTVLVCNGRAPTSVPGHDIADYCIASFEAIDGALDALLPPIGEAL